MISSSSFLGSLRSRLFARHLDTRRRERRDHAMLQELQELLTGDETVLDLGAGGGFLSLRLAGWLPRGQVLALDSSADMLDRLRQRAAQEGVADRIQTVRAEAEDNGVEAASVDLAVSIAVLHELSDPLAGLREVVRVLRPGGGVLFKDFRMSPIRGRISKLMHPAHCHGPFQPAALGTLMREAGLTEVAVTLDGSRMLLARGRKALDA